MLTLIRKTMGKKDFSSYPGDHVPLFNEEDLEHALTHIHAGLCVNPPINVIETERFFRVEVAVPGMKREDFLIQTLENKIVLSLLHKECTEEKSQDFQLHEFNYHCFKRTIVFPSYVDLDFLKAEYLNGMLYMYVPKTDGPVQHQPASIAVY